MKISKSDTKLPERVEVHTCTLGLYNDTTKAVMFNLVQTSVGEILKARSNTKNYKAFPMVFAVYHADTHDVLMVFPRPNKDYEGRFRYCPMLKEI